MLGLILAERNYLNGSDCATNYRQRKAVLEYYRERHGVRTTSMKSLEDILVKY